MQKYDPNPEPINYVDDGEGYEPSVAAILPCFCPIFRDLTSPITRENGNTAYPPVSKHKIERLFSELAIETENRYVTRGYSREQIKLTKPSKASASSATGLSCAYDIHTLRVTGITNLLEMGVPAHIVSEFIAGHMTLVMTLYYAKFHSKKIRQSILSAFESSHALNDTTQIFDQLKPDECADYLVRSDQYNDVANAQPSLKELIEQRGIWRYKNGGICPGTSCDDGGIYRKSDSRDKKNYESGPVKGGAETCGNCKYFLSGPAFILPQMLVANDLMLKMREIGRKRKSLWDNRARIEVAIDNGTATASQYSKLSLVCGELDSLDRKLEPMIMDWCNRLELFNSSIEKLNDWESKLSSDKTLSLFGGGEPINAKLRTDACEYSLVKEIVTQSELLGDRHIRSELGEHKLREFVDKIMINQNIEHLLLKIADKDLQRKASILLADAISTLAGGDHEAQSLAEGSALEPTKIKLLADIAHAITTNNADEMANTIPMETINVIE